MINYNRLKNEIDKTPYKVLMAKKTIKALLNKGIKTDLIDFKNYFCLDLDKIKGQCYTFIII